MDSAVMAIVTAVWKQFHEDLLIMSMSSLDVTNYYRPTIIHHSGILLVQTAE